MEIRSREEADMAREVQGVGEVKTGRTGGAEGAQAPRGGAGTAEARAAGRDGDTRQGGRGQQAGSRNDDYQASDELNDELDADQSDEARKKEDKKTEAEQAEEEKRKEQERKLKELDEKIEETQKKLHEAIQRGDNKEAGRLADEMGQLFKEREALSDAIDRDQGGQQQQPVESAGGAPAGAGGGGGPAGGGAPVGGGAPGGGFPAGGGAPGGFPMGGGAPAGGGAPGGGPGGGAPTASETNPTPPLNLQGDDKKTADFINGYLKSKGSPAAGQQAGELMVQYGKQYKVDPLILLSIAGQETQFGKTGIGVNGMLGVGAYDSDPNNATRNPSFSGVANQIRKGAETFARLRAKGGAGEDSPIAAQLSAVNRAGWATDPNWHNGVGRMYAQIAGAAGSVA